MLLFVMGGRIKQWSFSFYLLLYVHCTVPPSPCWGGRTRGRRTTRGRRRALRTPPSSRCCCCFCYCCLPWPFSIFLFSVSFKPLPPTPPPLRVRPSLRPFPPLFVRSLVGIGSRLWNTTAPPALACKPSKLSWLLSTVLLQYYIHTEEKEREAKQALLLTELVCLSNGFRTPSVREGCVMLT